MAYGPPVIVVFASDERPMDRADWLGIGIFLLVVRHRREPHVVDQLAIS